MAGTANNRRKHGAREASSPAKPALHIPEPLSTTRACTSSCSSSAILLRRIDSQKATCLQISSCVHSGLTTCTFPVSWFLSEAEKRHPETRRHSETCHAVSNFYTTGSFLPTGFARILSLARMARASPCMDAQSPVDAVIVPFELALPPEATDPWQTHQIQSSSAPSAAPDSPSNLGAPCSPITIKLEHPTPACKANNFPEQKATCARPADSPHLLLTRGKAEEADLPNYRLVKSDEDVAFYRGWNKVYEKQHGWAVDPCIRPIPRGKAKFACLVFSHQSTQVLRIVCKTVSRAGLFNHQHTDWSSLRECAQFLIGPFFVELIPVTNLTGTSPLCILKKLQVNITGRLQLRGRTGERNPELQHKQYKEPKPYPNQGARKANQARKRDLPHVALAHDQGICVVVRHPHLCATLSVEEQFDEVLVPVRLPVISFLDQDKDKRPRQPSRKRARRNGQAVLSVSSPFPPPPLQASEVPVPAKVVTKLEPKFEVESANTLVACSDLYR
eukprot:g48290.t1